MRQDAHVLVVDDDPRVCEMLREFLSGEGFQVSLAAGGDDMRAVIAKSGVDIVLLDLVMPGDDGLTLARELRRDTNVPIIMLTGKGDVIDRIVGLEIGADDYIAKPFHLREVLARIRSVLRRCMPGSESEPPSAATNAMATACLEFDGWRFDPARRTLHNADGTAIDLTTGEYELLRVFVENAGKVLNRDQLMDQAKGREWTPYDRAVDTQIGRLRRKIEPDPAKPVWIKTVRGVGYVFTPQVVRR